MFIPNYNKTAIINTAHIVKAVITEPYLEQRDYRVVASLSFGQGSSILHKGTEDSCTAYLAELYKTLN